MFLLDWRNEITVCIINLLQILLSRIHVTGLLLFEVKRVNSISLWLKENKNFKILLTNFEHIKYNKYTKGINI